MTIEHPQNLEKDAFINKSREVFPHGLMLGSTSVHKLEALKDACSRIGLDIDINSSSAESEVNAQPYGFDETYTGALNRARNAQKQSPDSPALGIENGVVPVGDKFVDLAVVVVLMPDGKSFMSTSAGIEFPKEAVERARAKGFDTTTVGSVIAETMGGSGTDPHSFLTGGKVSRREILTHAIEAALSQAIAEQ